MSGSSIYQLRIYRINPALKKEFDARFRDHASRIMHKYGFKIISIWYSKLDDSLEFVYLLQWPDEATKEKQWAAFMSDPEWEAIKQESREKYGEMVLSKVRDQPLNEVDWFHNTTS